MPLWGTLVGLTAEGDAVAGMMAQPFTGELFYATGGKAWYEGPGGRSAACHAQDRRACRGDALHDDAGAVPGRAARRL